jgi:O-antigen/teichoic acid export membrane protein
LRDAAIAHVVSIGLLFGSFAVAARVVSKETLGEYVLIGVIVELLGVLLDFGTRVTAVRFLSIQDHEQSEVAGTASGLWLLVGLGGGGVLGVSFWAIGPHVGLTVGQQVPILVGTMFCGQYVSFRFLALLQGCHAYGRYALVQSLSSALRFAAVIVLVAGFGLGLPGLLLAVTIAGFVSVALAWGALPIRIRPRIELRIVRAMLPLAWPVQISGLLALVYERTDAVMLGAYHGTPCVSAYEVAYRPLNQLRALFESLRAIFLPHLSRLYARGETGLAEESLRQALRVVSFVMTTGTVAVLGYGRWLMETLFTSRYIESSRVLAVLMAGVCVGLCNYAISTALVASGRPRLIVLPGAVEALVNVLANFLFTPAFGVMGAATASLVSRAAVNPLFLAAFPRDVRWRMASSFAPGLVSLGATWVLAVAWVGTARNPSVLAGLLLLGFHVCLCFLVGAVRPADLRVVAGALLSLTRRGGNNALVGTSVSRWDDVAPLDRHAGELSPSGESQKVARGNDDKVGLPR